MPKAFDSMVTQFKKDGLTHKGAQAKAARIFNSRSDVQSGRRDTIGSGHHGALRANAPPKRRKKGKSA